MIAKQLEKNPSNLNKILQDLSTHNIDSLNISRPRSYLMEKLGSVPIPTSLNDFDNIMGEESFRLKTRFWLAIYEFCSFVIFMIYLSLGAKKMHEVAILNDAIFRLSKILDIKMLVDLGSGKGYLSQILATFHNLEILAIDAQEGNTEGALKRVQNLEVRIYFIHWRKRGLRDVFAI